MKHKSVFLLLCCFLLAGSPVLHANSTDPSTAAPAVTCNLPAPGNIQYIQVTPYTIHFSWDTVPGAAGYRSVLTRVSNGAQQTNVGYSDNADFAVIPGEKYHFMVAAACSVDPPEFSPNIGEMLLTTQSIVIDLVVDYQNCTPSNTIYDNNPDPQIWGYPFEENQDYYLEFQKISPNNPTQLKKIRLVFRRSGSGFQMGEMSGDDGNGNLCGISINPPYNECAQAPASVSSSKVTFGGSTSHFSFPSMAEIYFYNVSTFPPEVPFNSFTIYRTCTGGHDGGGGGGTTPGGGRSDEPSDDTGITNSNLKVITVNPFTDLLTLKFPNPPEGPVKTRLIDLQGIPKIETIIQPGEMNENTYSIPTDALPAGLYFLQMETQSGQMIVQKVLKI